MAGKILHKGALVLCPHTPGAAQPDQTAARVTVSGQEVATLLPLYTVTGCGLNGTNSPPCTKAQWLKGAEHVFVGGVPVVIASGTSLCTPSGASLDPRVFQQRVTAS
jgi:hypothetical protein